MRELRTPGDGGMGKPRLVFSNARWCSHRGRPGFAVRHGDARSSVDVTTTKRQ
jgi:hypothetical protein